MSAAKIIEEIKRLPKPELRNLATWLNGYLDDEWDRQMKSDAKPGGKLDRMVREVKADVKAGRVSEIKC